MINNEKHREKDEEMDDGAFTGFKTSDSRVSCEKLKKTRILSAPEGGHSRVWGAGLEKALKPNCCSSTLGIGSRD